MVWFEMKNLLGFCPKRVSSRTKWAIINQIEFNYQKDRITKRFTRHSRKCYCLALQLKEMLQLERKYRKTWEMFQTQFFLITGNRIYLYLCIRAKAYAFQVADMALVIPLTQNYKNNSEFKLLQANMFLNKVYKVV